MSSFTFEECNLIQIFMKERQQADQGRYDLINEMKEILPHVDADMSILVGRTINKLSNLSDEQFLNQTFISDL